MTDEELDALQTSGLDKTAPYGITGVSQSQFSVARYYGGCTFQGRVYTYISDSDELIRADVFAWLKKRRKKVSKAK